VLVFMRDVKSRSYYEQMKGRGTRTCSLEQLRATGTPSAKFTKDHFVIIDAIGVESSQKTDSRPLEKQPGVSLKNLLEHVAMGNRDEAVLTTLANRLLRLDKQINATEQNEFARQARGMDIRSVVQQLLQSHDPDIVDGLSVSQHNELLEKATRVFNNPELREFIIDVRKKYDQIIDHINIDQVTHIGWVKDQEANAEQTIQHFSQWIDFHKDEITALQIFYDQPFRRRDLTYAMVKDLYDKIKLTQPHLAPLSVWRAYEQLGHAQGSVKNELTALVSLVRKVSGIDTALTPFDKTVDKNFQEWVFRKQAGTVKFTVEQMNWLRMIKDTIAHSFHVDRDDFDLDPFNKQGGLGRMWQLFGDQADSIINELNEVLVA
jgi:type I restriction enzyme, R subunit